VTCAKCGSRNIQLVDDRGGTGDGEAYTEEYRCKDCHATGQIRGTVGVRAQYQGEIFL
jgi:hypothetical protein